MIEQVPLTSLLDKRSHINARASTSFDSWVFGSDEPKAFARRGAMMEVTKKPARRTASMTVTEAYLSGYSAKRVKKAAG